MGNGSITTSKVPVLVDSSGVLAGKTVIAIAAGYYHSLALCADGTLVAWGYNGYGQLGNNSTTNSSVPVVVDRAGVLAGKTVTAIAAGASHSLALCADGTLAAWGCNDDGQLGNNSTVNQHGAGGGEPHRRARRQDGQRASPPAPLTASRLCADGTWPHGATTITASWATTAPPPARCRCR